MRFVRGRSCSGDAGHPVKRRIYRPHGEDRSFRRKFLVSHFSHGLINCPEEGKWGFINNRGEFEIAPQYVSACPFREGLAAVAPHCEQAFCFIDTRTSRY